MWWHIASQMRGASKPSTHQHRQAAPLVGYVLPAEYALRARDAAAPAVIEQVREGEHAIAQDERDAARGDRIAQPEVRKK